MSTTSDSDAQDSRELSARLLDEARETSGRGGPRDRRGLLRILREDGVSIYPLLAILALTVSDQIATSGSTSNDINRTFGLDAQYLTLMGLIGQIISLAVPLSVARYVQNRPRRALVLLVTQGLWVLFNGMTGLVVSVGGLAAVGIANAVTSSAQGTVASALLIDLYPPKVRVRVVSYLTVAALVSGLLTSGVGVLLTSTLGLNWRGVEVVTAGFAFVLFLFALGLRDPGYGAHDSDQVRSQIREHLGTHTDQGEARPPIPLSVFEAVRRILAIPTMRLLAVTSMFSALAFPLNIYVMFSFANRFSLDLNELATYTFITTLVTICAYLVMAPIGDRIFSRSPRQLFRIVGFIGLGLHLVGVAYLWVTSLPQFYALGIVTIIAASLTGPAVLVGTLSVVPANLRPHTGAVTMIFSLLGTAVGTAVFTPLVNGMGLLTAVVLQTGVGMVTGGLAIAVGKYIGADLDSQLEEVIEDELLAHRAESGRPLPVLSTRAIDYSYGSVQVLHDVDFVVEPGERVALLGLNGSGKSTLLRAISGLGYVSSGSVRLDGHDITYIDPDRRARLGIIQIPGSKAIYPELTVREHLETYLLALPRSERSDGPSRIEDALRTLPRLQQRLHQPAGLLSGGEQQMLALAKAVMTRPRVLLIDELSLGLAPHIVGELIEVVLQINARGTAVVVVEQSINVAAALADRAYFMEKGRIRFNGPIAELAERPDLLRAVFLGEQKDLS